MGLVARVGTLRVLPLWAQQCPYKYGRCIRPADVSRETHLKTKHFTLHISHLIIYSGVFIAAVAGAGGFEVLFVVELD